RRAFTEDDANFLQAIANVLASAIARRAAEEQRLELEERLRQAQKMEAVGQLAAGIAHDFNNLLTVIQGYGELVLAGMDDDDPRRRDVLEIAGAADRAAQLTSRLLTFSRRERARTELVDVSALVSGLESLLRRTLGEQVDLHLALAPSLPPVVSDPGELEQVLLNLAVNARDAMPLGGVLTISTDGLEVDARLARHRPELSPGRYVRLSVADTGLGMTADVKARALEPFFTTKEQGYGTGLGLATVWGIVSQAGGALELDSAHGDGTTVSVVLPAGAVGAPSPGVPSSASAPVQTGGETVLVVEDEPSVRELISRILSEHGYRVLAAGDGAEALALVERHEARLDLLLTDVVLPGVSGSELVAILTAARPGLSVLAMSGYAGEGIAHGRRLDDGVPFLAKPFSREALLSAVRDALRGGRV
ncbi:MAG: response regulator, partial [Gemmatimonadota bacterium]